MNKAMALEHGTAQDGSGPAIDTFVNSADGMRIGL
jgi:hypothetical protein